MQAKAKSHTTPISVWSINTCAITEISSGTCFEPIRPVPFLPGIVTKEKPSGGIHRDV